MAGFDGVDFGWVELCLCGLISFTNSFVTLEILTQGSGNQLAPKLAMYVKSPTAAPLAAAVVPGIKHEKTRTMLKHWPTVPHRNSFRRPTRSMMNQDTVAKIA